MEGRSYYLVKRYRDRSEVHRRVESFRDPIAPSIQNDLLPDDILQQHFTKMQTYRLLKEGEHLQLFHKIETGLAAYDTFMNSNSGRPPTEEQERACLDLVAAFESLTVTNLRLATSVARQYSGLPLADLIQEATTGLRRGLCRFDHTLAYAPSTYLTFWIRMAVSRAISKNARLIRVTEEGQRIDNARRKLGKRLGREPSVQEISDHTGHTPKVVVNTVASMGTLPEGLVYLDALPFESLDVAEIVVEEVASLQEDTQRAQIRSLFEQPELSDEVILVLALRTGTLRNVPDELRARLGKQLASDEALRVSLARDEPLDNREVARLLGITFVREKELYAAALQAARTLLTVDSKQP